MKKLLVIGYLLLAGVARSDCPVRYWVQEDCRVTYIPGLGYYEVCGYWPYPDYAVPNYRPNWAHESFYWEKSGVPYNR